MAQFDFFVVIDFEATCDENRRIYPQEIIEFPAVLVNAADGTVLSEFRTYVRPRHHPRLTTYCVDLTGIQQHQVDAGVDLAEALALHDAWLRAAAGGRSFAVVAWGDWDLRTMLESECRFKGLAKPAYFDRWVNLRVHFEAAFGRREPRRNLFEAVGDAGLQWQGRWHCGLNDARNAARLLAELMRRGVTISMAPAPPRQPESPQPQVATYPCYCGVASSGGDRCRAGASTSAATGRRSSARCAASFSGWTNGRLSAERHCQCRVGLNRPYAHSALTVCPLPLRRGSGSSGGFHLQRPAVKHIMLA